MKVLSQWITAHPFEWCNTMLNVHVFPLTDSENSRRNKIDYLILSKKLVTSLNRWHSWNKRGGLILYKHTCNTGLIYSLLLRIGFRLHSLTVGKSSAEYLRCILVWTGYVKYLWITSNSWYIVAPDAASTKAVHTNFPQHLKNGRVWSCFTQKPSHCINYMYSSFTNFAEWFFAKYLRGYPGVQKQYRATKTIFTIASCKVVFLVTCPQMENIVLSLFINSRLLKPFRKN